MNQKQPKEMTDLEAAVWELIQMQRGEENSISRGSLLYSVQKYFKIKCSDREIRDAIQHLVIDFGKLIITNYGRGGYYLPANSEETKTYTQSLRSHAMSMLVHEAAIRKINLEEILAEIQMTLPLEEVSA